MLVNPNPRSPEQSAYDELVDQFRAIQRSSPGTPPPEQLADELYAAGIRWRDAMASESKRLTALADLAGADLAPNPAGGNGPNSGNGNKPPRPRPTVHNPLVDGMRGNPTRDEFIDSLVQRSTAERQYESLQLELRGYSKSASAHESQRAVKPQPPKHLADRLREAAKRGLVEPGSVEAVFLQYGLLVTPPVNPGPPEYRGHGMLARARDPRMPPR